MRLDKKVSGGELKFVLARRLGDVVWGQQVPDAEIHAVLDELLDASEESQPQEEPQDRDNRPRGQIQGLEPIPRFSPDRSKRVEP